ncbi:MAG: hypothetical protein AABY86_01235 [Bdellovibrionota bacterium]
MKEIRLGLKILSTLTKDRIQYPGRFVTDTVGMLARCGILLLLYHYVYKLNNDNINGTYFLEAAWSIFFYFAFSVLRLRDISHLIMQDVRSGNVEVLFSKPISYITYRCWWQVGIGLYSFVVLTLAIALVLFLLIGIPDAMRITVFLPSLLLVIFLGVILSLLLYVFIGLLAFWIEDVMPLYWIVDKAVMILGGSYLPVALFPKYLYLAAKYSPFGATHFITQTTSSHWGNDWINFSLIQFFWIIIFLAFVSSLFSLARAKVSVNGG